jgi:hypothetical protein
MNNTLDIPVYRVLRTVSEQSGVSFSELVERFRKHMKSEMSLYCEQTRKSEMTPERFHIAFHRQLYYFVCGCYHSLKIFDLQPNKHASPADWAHKIFEKEVTTGQVWRNK